MDREALEALGREELVVEARGFGVKRPEVMTRVELVDEVLRLATPNPVERRQVRGWLGVARDLLASAVERGLNLPDAAAMIRGEVQFVPLQPHQPPVATVTLAEIYGAQGHFERALGMLDEVLTREPDHEIARRLRVRLGTERDTKQARAGEKEPQSVAPAEPEDEAEPATLPPAPDPETLPPAERTDPESDGAPDAPTLPPVRSRDDEPEHATLMPARPEAAELAEDEPEHVTLMPARADVAALGYDELEEETVIPSESIPSHPAIALAASSNAAAPADDMPGEGVSAVTTEEPSEATVIFARTGAGTAAVYFEVGDLVAGGAQALVLRVVEHRPRADGIERVERDLPVTERRGTATVADLESGSVLRAALGRKWDGEFRAAVVGAEVCVANEGVSVAWAPRRDVDYAAVAGRAGLATATSA